MGNRSDADPHRRERRRAGPGGLADGQALWPLLDDVVPRDRVVDPRHRGPEGAVPSHRRARAAARLPAPESRPSPTGGRRGGLRRRPRGAAVRAERREHGRQPPCLGGASGPLSREACSREPGRTSDLAARTVRDAAEREQADGPAVLADHRIRAVAARPDGLSELAERQPGGRDRRGSIRSATRRPPSASRRSTYRASWLDAVRRESTDEREPCAARPRPRRRARQAEPDEAEPEGTPMLAESRVAQRSRRAPPRAPSAARARRRAAAPGAG